MPTAKPCEVACTASRVELLPVLPTICSWSPYSLAVCAMSMMCSSQLMSCPSPVVPPTIRPPTPASICFSTSASYAARSTLPLGRYGVLIAVIRRVALISSTEAVVDFIVEFVHALDATHCGGGFGIASAAGRKKRKRGLRRTERGRRGGGHGAPWWTRARACVWNRDETRRSGRWTPGRPWRTPCCSSAAWWCGSKCGGVWFRGFKKRK